MKIFLGFIYLLITISACKITHKEKYNIIGSYHALYKTKDKFLYIYNVEIHNDSSFHFSIKTQDANPECSGYWYISGDTLLLKCNEIKAPDEMLTNGYMVNRTNRFKIINKNKLKFGKIFLNASNKR